MIDWIDPRPRFPASGTRCVVKCDDSTLRIAVAEHTWDGWRWKDQLTGSWSMAHPQIIGWKRYGDASDDERLQAERFHDQFLPKEYRRHAQRTNLEQS